MNRCVLMALTVAYIVCAPLDTEALDPEIPKEIEEACIKYGEAYNICPELLEAICYEESRYKADVTGGSCKGLMQINVPYQKHRITKLHVTDIYDIDSNIHVGADLLAELFNDYSEDAGTVLMLYHGEKDAMKNGKDGKYSDYAQKVLDRAEELERAHGK